MNYCTSYGIWLSFPDETPGLKDAIAIRDEYKSSTSPDGRITCPGKFEGEPIFAPYYWHIGLSGFADADDGHAYTFRFRNGCDDFVLWPELKTWLGRSRTLTLFVCGQGFVYAR